jgi:hypothetical protein
MRECEHTCSGHSKIQARAVDPSKYLAEIRTDGTCGQAVRNVAQRPLPEGRAPEPYMGYLCPGQTYAVKHYVVCTGVLVFARDPLLRRTYVRTHPTLASKKPTY